MAANVATAVGGATTVVASLTDKAIAKGQKIKKNIKCKKAIDELKEIIETLKKSGIKEARDIAENSRTHDNEQTEYVRGKFFERIDEKDRSYGFKEKITNKKPQELKRTEVNWLFPEVADKVECLKEAEVLRKEIASALKKWVAAVAEAKADSPAKASEAEAVAEVAAVASDKEEAKVEAAASAKADAPWAASPAKAESPKASPAKADSPR